MSLHPLLHVPNRFSMANKQELQIFHKAVNKLERLYGEQKLTFSLVIVSSFSAAGLYTDAVSAKELGKVGKLRLI